ncbi:hypothetical protein B0H14DRAFT_2593523 [Mycena olivaceomarginata]|nr:hypothetical protein B0H14DRAFT_2593523 [Mycena olivaceomarginata]
MAGARSPAHTFDLLITADTAINNGAPSSAIKTAPAAAINSRIRTDSKDGYAGRWSLPPPGSHPATAGPGPVVPSLPAHDPALVTNTVTGKPPPPSDSCDGQPSAPSTGVAPQAKAAQYYRCQERGCRSGLVASEVVGVEQRSNEGTSQGRWGSDRVVEVE